MNPSDPNAYSTSYPPTPSAGNPYGTPIATIALSYLDWLARGPVVAHEHGILILIVLVMAILLLVTGVASSLAT